MIVLAHYFASAATCVPCQMALLNIADTLACARTPHKEHASDCGGAFAPKATSRVRASALCLTSLVSICCQRSLAREQVCLLIGSKSIPASLLPSCYAEVVHQHNVVLAFQQPVAPPLQHLHAGTMHVSQASKRLFGGAVTMARQDRQVSQNSFNIE